MSSSSSSTSGNRLAGLPRIPKKQSKKPKAASPPKPRTRPLPPPAPPAPKPASTSTAVAAAAASSSSIHAPSGSKAAKKKPKTAVVITLSDDDTLSELSSVPSSSSSSSSEEEDSSSDDDEDKATNAAKPAAIFPGFGALPSLPGFGSLPALPPLPAIPNLPSLPAKSQAPGASTSAATALPLKKAVSTPTVPSASSAAASKARPRPTPPAPKAASASPAPPPIASTSTGIPLSAKPAPSPFTSAVPLSPRSKPPSASTSRASSAEAAYVPHTSTASRQASNSRPMSLRQVLALSLQEAQEKEKEEAASRAASRESSAAPSGAAFAPPDARELQDRAKGSKGKEREKLSDVSDLDLEDDEDDEDEEGGVESDSDGKQSSDEEDGEDEDGTAMQKEEERLLRREMERKKKKKRQMAERAPFFAESEVGMELDFGSDADETDDETDLGEAWERNARAMERLRQRRSSGGAGPGEADVSLDTVGGLDEDDDSDLAVTELPPGNGLGVVTWSDYDSFDDDEHEQEEEDQLAAALAAAEGNESGLAGEFEDELEQLFALSEAVVGPIRHDEYGLGDLWLEALSPEAGDGSEGDTESMGEKEGEDGEEDVDAEMIFGPDGELKRLFGRRRRNGGLEAVESSAGESDEDGSSDDEGAEGDEMQLVRVGVALEQLDRALQAAGGTGGDDADATASASVDQDETEDEATDSSCSETDIYRYAPRTGALSAVQAPTTADLASLNGEAVVLDQGKKAASSSARPAASKQKQKAKARLPSISESGVATAAAAAEAAKRSGRKGPMMGTFDAPTRPDAAPGNGGLTVVVIDESGALAPSPFSVPKKPKRSLGHLTPSRRSRADSHVSTTSATSGSLSADLGSNIGSPVLANVDFGFDFDSVLHESVLGGEEDEVDAIFAMATGASSSESEAEATATDGAGPASSASKPSALSDFSRWSRIPIGAFRSRTMRGPGTAAPSQVYAAKAAATEAAREKRKRAASGESDGGATTSTSAAKRKKRASSAGPPIANSLLRDAKATASLHHTLGSPAPEPRPGKKASSSNSRKAITSRMLTSPVLSPQVRVSPPRSYAAAAAAGVELSGPSVKKLKRGRSKRTTPAGSVRGQTPDPSSAKKTRSRSQSRQPLGAGLSAAATSSMLSAPSAGLPPLHSPLFKNIAPLPEDDLHLH
ncbi:hypothetical protein JCM11251_005799 [Rhodosporidiobolus azoricus]